MLRVIRSLHNCEPITFNLKLWNSLGFCIVLLWFYVWNLVLDPHGQILINSLIPNSKRFLFDKILKFVSLITEKFLLSPTHTWILIHIAKISTNTIRYQSSYLQTFDCIFSSDFFMFQLVKILKKISEKRNRTFFMIFYLNI